jgi:hypothetical protein
MVLHTLEHSRTCQVKCIVSQQVEAYGAYLNAQAQLE